MIEYTLLPVEDVALFKRQALLWANQFAVLCLLDNNNYSPDPYQSVDWILAVDALEFIEAENNSFQSLKEFAQGKQENIFGFFSYELKNEIEQLNSNHTDNIGFPNLYFFKPRYEFSMQGTKVRINRNYVEAFHILEQILFFKQPEKNYKAVTLQLRTSKEKYENSVNHIREQIIEGNFYEMNYCIEEFAENATINPVNTFDKLNAFSKAPFSSFFKLNDGYVLCASPERFLKKIGNKIISQPIKGTIKKGGSMEENKLLQFHLLNDKKERAENVMIVDLVRNDLARLSKPGTVKVEELCGVYEFPTVNHMISTITAEVKDGIHFTEVIKMAFPMGSMTGAPKIEVLKTIEETEDFQRGIYSGSIGYITPTGDFDFNVVIRSILYNAAKKYLSLRAGSAITYDSNAAYEWDEIMLKLDALKRSLQE